MKATVICGALHCVLIVIPRFDSHEWSDTVRFIVLFSWVIEKRNGILFVPVMTEYWYDIIEYGNKSLLNVFCLLELTIQWDHHLIKLVAVPNMGFISRCLPQLMTINKGKTFSFGRTLVARTLMARLPQLFWTHSWVPRKNPMATEASDFICAIERFNKLICSLVWVFAAGIWNKHLFVSVSFYITLKWYQISCKYEDSTEWEATEFLQMFCPSCIILRILRLKSKQCRSRLGSSSWAASSGSRLLANLIMFISWFFIYWKYLKILTNWFTCQNLLVKLHWQIACMLILQTAHAGAIVGWIDDSQFYVLFNSISVILGWWSDDNERLCAIEPCLWLRRFCLGAQTWDC